MHITDWRATLLKPRFLMSPVLNSVFFINRVRVFWRQVRLFSKVSPSPVRVSQYARYASSTLINLISAKPVRKEYKRIEMMLGAVNKVISVFNLSISNVVGDFELETEVTQVDRNELLTLKNPKYRDMLCKFEHLKDVTMHNIDEKPELPVHLILGASEYARIKTETKPRIGLPGEPVAELTKFGWTVLSPGKEIDPNCVSRLRAAVQTRRFGTEGLCNR